MTGASGAWIPATGKTALESSLLHASPAAGGRLGRRNSIHRSLRDRLHHRPAQHLPSGVPEARRCLARQGHQLQREVQPKYTFDVYNLTNTTSFDVPGNEVSQNQYYNAFPVAGTTPLPTGCAADGSQTNSSFYNCPAGLGIVTHTIGSPRQVQMSLRFDF